MTVRSGFMNFNLYVVVLLSLQVRVRHVRDQGRACPALDDVHIHEQAHVRRWCLVRGSRQVSMENIVFTSLPSVAYSGTATARITGTRWSFIFDGRTGRVVDPELLGALQSRVRSTL